MKVLLAVMLMANASIAGAAAMPAPAHTEDWCADTVDFAMRTAQRREEGTSKPSLANEIHEHFIVFQQQYPTLNERDMQQLVNAVYQRRSSRFKAAVDAGKACGPVQSANAQSESPASAGAPSE